MHRAHVVAAVLVGAVLLSACGAAASGSADPTTPTSGGTSAPDVVPQTPDDAAPTDAAPTAEALQDWVADATWSFAPEGLLEPVTLTFRDGQATGEHFRTYEIGVGIEGDVNSDGIPDLVVPVSEIDGNGFLELWYVWLGTGATEGALAEQVIYPIARTTRCGDTVHSVTAIDGGFRIDQTLWMPHTDRDRDCVSGGSGAQLRDVTVEVVDGVPHPVQTAPIQAWGGVCPRSLWLDGIPEDGAEVRAAPPAGSRTVITPGEMIALYELGEAPLLTRDGARFFGFQPADLPSDSHGGAGATAIAMHCGFAG